LISAYGVLDFKNNLFVSNDCGNNPCFSLDTQIIRTSPSAIFDGNIFVDNSGYSILEIDGNELLSFQDNHFIDNPTTLCTVSINSIVSIHNCIFANGATQYEIYMELPNTNGPINATYNWWNTTNDNQISGRIFDNQVNLQLASLVYIPFLQSSPIQCNDVNNCSNQGICYDNNSCYCNENWTGDDCSKGEIIIFYSKHLNLNPSQADIINVETSTSDEFITSSSNSPGSPMNIITYVLVAISTLVAGVSIAIGIYCWRARRRNGGYYALNTLYKEDEETLDEEFNNEEYGNVENSTHSSHSQTRKEYERINFQVRYEIS
jgi:hypothetical protein